MILGLQSDISNRRLDSGLTGGMWPGNKNVPS